MAVAALSGVVGNASYDLVKLVIRKIRNSVRDDSNLDIPRSEQEIEIFIEYVREYHTGEMETDDLVISAVREEELADATGAASQVFFEKNEGDLAAFSSPEFREIILAALRDATKIPEPVELPGELWLNTKESDPQT